MAKITNNDIGVAIITAMVFSLALVIIKVLTKKAEEA